MKYLWPAFLSIFVVFAASLSTVAQENDVKVVDEVVAVVNDGVITLSGVRKQMKGDVEQMVQSGMKRDDAQKKVDEHQGELIANLINEELLIQKAKELGIEKDVEAELNSRMLQIMKEQNFKTLDALYEAMRKEGIDPEDIRANWRKDATRSEVIRRDVQAKVYWEPTGTQVKAYYEANKSKFTKPETVTLSEIFLNFAGQNQDAVRAKARQLIEQLRGGADFAKMVTENSESKDAAQTKGSLGSMSVKELEQQCPSCAAAIKNVKVGGISDPVEDDIGLHIVRVDDRSAASNESQFDEDAVRRAMMDEKFPEALKKYMAKLRDDSYIKINETYRPMVSPLLFADERTAKPTAKN
jgi:peptidyl-prolyl cis-trans isomerase SurA